MRNFSNNQSIERSEVTILSLIETFISLCLSYYIYITTGSIIYNLLAVLFAPILLLKSDQSIRLGLNIYSAGFDKFNEAMSSRISDDQFKSVTALNFIFAIAFIVSVTFFAFAVRFISTFVTLIRHPIVSLSQIPSNWKKIALCTDSFTPPELLPGLHNFERAQDLEFLNASTWYSLLAKQFSQPRHEDPSSEDRTTPFRVVRVVFGMVGLIFVTCPALAYRMSLKSTFLVWSPLIWVVSSAADTSSFRSMLMRYTETSIARFSRIYSAVIIVAFSTKYLFLYTLTDFANKSELMVSQHLLFQIIEPRLLPWWQVAAFINAIFSWVVYFAADYYLKEMENNDHFKETWHKSAIVLIQIFRNVLSAYTAFCTLSILYLEYDPKFFDALSSRIFPWQ